MIKLILDLEDFLFNLIKLLIFLFDSFFQFFQFLRVVVKLLCVCFSTIFVRLLLKLLAGLFGKISFVTLFDNLLLQALNLSLMPNDLGLEFVDISFLTINNGHELGLNTANRIIITLASLLRNWLIICGDKLLL